MDKKLINESVLQEKGIEVIQKITLTYYFVLWKMFWRTCNMDYKTILKQKQYFFLVKYYFLFHTYCKVMMVVVGGLTGLFHRFGLK